MLQSLIAIDLFPSDLSGSKVGSIFRDLALPAHTQEVLIEAYDIFGSSLSKMLF